jgi:hypothetical protein
MVFNATFNNISFIPWQSVLLVEDIGENLPHVSSTPHLSVIQTHNFLFQSFLGQKKYMCVYCRMSKKFRVGRSGLIFLYFFLLLSTKPEIVVPGSGISFSKFPVK